MRCADGHLAAECGRQPNQAHFQHLGGSKYGCSGSEATARESERHLQGIDNLYRWLLAQDPQCAPIVNRQLPGTTRRPDLTVWVDDRPVTVEYQHSTLSPEQARQRAADAMAASPGALNLWVFDRNADNGGRHFAYGAGNQQFGGPGGTDPAWGKSIVLNKTLAELVTVGAQVAWLDSPEPNDGNDNDGPHLLTVPYFLRYDTSRREPDSVESELHLGRPEPRRSVDRYTRPDPLRLPHVEDPPVKAYAVTADLHTATVSADHRELEFPRAASAIAYWNRRITTMVQNSENARAAAVEAQRVRAEQEAAARAQLALARSSSRGPGEG